MKPLGYLGDAAILGVDLNRELNVPIFRTNKMPQIAPAAPRETLVPYLPWDTIQEFYKKYGIKNFEWTIYNGLFRREYEVTDVTKAFVDVNDVVLPLYPLIPFSVCCLIQWETEDRKENSRYMLVTAGTLDRFFDFIFTKYCGIRLLKIKKGGT